MAQEFKTDWDAAWAETLNKEVPAILKDIHFDTWASELSMECNGKTYYFKGAEFIKIVVAGDKKEYFIKALKGDVLNDDFPLMVQIFIRDNLGYAVNRKCIA